MLRAVRHFDGPLAGFSELPPESYGTSCYTLDPGVAAGSTPVVSGRVWCAKVHVWKTASISTLSSYVTAAALSVLGYCGYAVYSDGATMGLLGATAGDSLLLTVAGWRPKALASPVVLAAGSEYWLAVLALATTVPSFASSVGVSAAAITNGLPGGSVAGVLAGQTAFPSTIARSGLTPTATRPLVVGY